MNTEPLCDYDKFLFIRGDKVPRVSTDWIDGDGRWVLPGTGVSIEIGTLLRLRKEPFSTCTFFYASSPDLFIASTSWLEVVRTLNEQGLPLLCDLDYAWQYLQSQCPLTNKTFCRGVYALRSGEEVKLEPGFETGAILQKYVPTLVNGKGKDIDLRKWLGASLQEIALGNSAFHLSAGLDSSILVILARELNPESSIKAYTCNALGKGAGDEVPNTQRLACDYHLDLTVYDFTEIDVLQAGKRLIGALHYPIAHPSHLIRFLLDESIAKEDIGCVVTGRGADECLAGYPWHLPEYADPAMHKNRVLATPQELLQLIFKEEGQSVSFSEWPKPGPIALGDRLQYDWWTIFESWNSIDRNLSTHLGLNYVNPFLDKSLAVQLLSTVEPAGRVLKKYLKEYFKDTYPRYVLEYPKHGLTADINTYLMNYSIHEILDAIFAGSHFAERYLRKAEIEKLIDTTLSGTEQHGWQIWSLYLCTLTSQKIAAIGEQTC